MYTLYSIPGSCSTGITVLLTKLELDFEIVKTNEMENYADIVPTNQVPALKDGDKIITEGAAIVLYLLEKHKNDILPQDITQKGEFLQYLMFNNATLHPAYSKVFTANAILTDGDEKTNFLNALADNLSKYWAIIDKRLANRKYVTGDKPTVIDYLIAIYTSWNSYFPMIEVTLGDNVKRLTEEIIELPEFKAAYKKEGVGFTKTF
jgi:glutathione S-transferase